MLKVGQINRLKVNRKTDIGFMLEDKEDTVFLHNNESLHQNLKSGDVVDAFLYYDQKGRLAATLRKPILTLNEQAFLVVEDVVPNLGVFLTMGINKGLLLSKDDLPLNPTLWPKIGDEVYVELRTKSKLVAKIPPKTELQDAPNEPLELKSTVTAYVYKQGKEGLNLLTKERHLIFVHQSLTKEQYRIGQPVDVKITFQSEKGYSGSLIPQKEVLLFEDANQVLNYLIIHKEVPLTSDSAPEDILEYFPMSKKAFKRAIGSLYKARRIDFSDGKTILVK